MTKASDFICIEKRQKHEKEHKIAIKLERFGSQRSSVGKDEVVEVDSSRESS